MYQDPVTLPVSQEQGEDKTSRINFFLQGRGLYIISMIYIFLPCVLFCIGWLKVVFWVPLCIIIVAALYLSLKRKDDNIENEEILSFKPLTMLLILGMVIVIVGLSGTGGYSHQDVDFIKHNSLLKDLIEYEWPIGYSHAGPEFKPYVLAIYVGYYLPAAVVGKVFGWAVANHFSYFWAVTGIMLTIMWFLKLTGKVSFWFALLFIFFGGMDVIAYALLHSWPISTKELYNVLDLWLVNYAPYMKGVFWLFPSNITMLYVSPHHILPGWMIVMIIMYNTIHRKSVKELLLLWAATSVYSAFVFVGLMPFVLLSLYLTRLKGVFSFQNLVAGSLLLVFTGLYTISNDADYPKGWMWEYHNMFEKWPLLFLFYMTEFGIFAFFCPKLASYPKHFPQRIWWWTAIVVLLFCPWYRMGTFCDFTSKACLPSLIVFLVYIASTIRYTKTEQEKMCAHILIFLLFIGSFTGQFRVARAPAHKGVSLSPPSVETIPNMGYLFRTRWDVAKQMLADPEKSFFWRYMAPEPQYHSVYEIKQ